MQENETWVLSLGWEDPLEEGTATLQYSCLENPHGQKDLTGCSPWGREESDTTEQLHFHFSLSCIGEVNGNALQCSCLENPRDGGAWWAAIYGVTQSWTRLKRLSSSSSGKESTCQCRRMKRGFYPWVGKIPWRRACQPTLVFFRGEFHGERSLVGYSP